MEHKKKRKFDPLVAGRKKRGKIKFTLRWGIVGGVRDDVHTYYGDTLDAKYTFGEYRARLIDLGIERGYKFVGEVREIPGWPDPQIRIPLKYSTFKKVTMLKDFLILYDTKTGRVEGYVRKDNATGEVIEHNTYAYDYDFTLTNWRTSGELTEDQIRLVEEYMRDIPTEQQLKPVEQVEREVWTEISDEHLAEFERTGRTRLPVPTREELEANTNSVEIAARDDSGKVVPTAAYFAMNPLSPDEITVKQAERNAHNALARVIVSIAADKCNQETKDFSLMLEAVHKSTHSPDHEIERIIQQGTRFDFETLSQDLEACLEIEELSESIKATARDMMGILMMQQQGHYPGYIYTPPFVHLISSESTSVVTVGHPTGMCGETAEKFVGLDQYKAVGAPPFTPICPDCLNKMIGQDFIASQEGRSEAHLTLTQPARPTLGDLIDTEGISVPSDVFSDLNSQLRENGLPEVALDETLPDNTIRAEAEELYGKEVQIPKELRELDAQIEFENWVKHHIMPENPKHVSFYYWGHFEDGSHIALCLFNYGTQHHQGADRPMVHYLLIRTGSRHIIKQGSDFSPNASNWDEPTSARAAAELLSFWVEDDPDVTDDWLQDLYWRDQYGQVVPRDLIPLDDAATHNEDGSTHQRAMNAAWYDISDFLFVSATDVPCEDDVDSMADMGIDVAQHRIMRVDDVLKRFDPDPDLPNGGRYYTA